jgi:hypothetical protein
MKAGGQVRFLQAFDALTGMLSAEKIGFPQINPVRAREEMRVK